MVRKRLALALANLDRAGVFTVHGFARRMLERYAFESRASLAADYSEDERHVADEAIRDFWRQYVYSLSPDAAAAVLDVYDMQQFTNKVRALLKRPDLSFTGVPRQSFETLVADVDARAEGLREWWRDFGAQAAEKLGALPLKKEGREARDSGIAALNRSRDAHGAIGARALRGLSRDYLESEVTQAARKTSDGHAVPDSTLFRLADALAESRRALGARLLHDAVTEVRKQLRATKARTGKLGYEDLLRLIDEGLSGPGGEDLAAAIRRHYPVALIDEFQDTDPLQWRVFHRLYGSGAGALFLVGDPKQAIYAFRGADVYAYLDASRGTRDR